MSRRVIRRSTLSQELHAIEHYLTSLAGWIDGLAAHELRWADTPKGEEGRACYRAALRQHAAQLLDLAARVKG